MQTGLAYWTMSNDWSLNNGRWQETGSYHGINCLASLSLQWQTSWLHIKLPGSLGMQLLSLVIHNPARYSFFPLWMRTRFKPEIFAPSPNSWRLMTSLADWPLMKREYSNDHDLSASPQLCTNFASSSTQCVMHLGRQICGSDYYGLLPFLRG